MNGRPAPTNHSRRTNTKHWNLPNSIDSNRSLGKRPGTQHMMRAGTYGHDDCAKQQKKHQICGLSSERALLQEPAVADHEVHVEEEVDREQAKEEEVCEQPPNLCAIHTDNMYECTWRI